MTNVGMSLSKSHIRERINGVNFFLFKSNGIWPKIHNVTLIRILDSDIDIYKVDEFNCRTRNCVGMFITKGLLFFFGEKNSTALLRNMTIIEYRAGTVEYIQNRLFTAI